MKTYLSQLNKTKGYALSSAGWGRMMVTLLFWSLLASAAIGQSKEWDKTYGGSHNDALSVVKPTPDGGYILGGSSYSGDNGDKTHTNQGMCDASSCTNDYWVIKLDSVGNKEWDKTFGGHRSDFLTALELTSDGGYILGGYSSSDISGDKTGSNRGSYDYWVVKLDASGIKEWDKTLGGTEADALACLKQTPDGGYILGGSSPSSRNDVKSENSKGNVDYWVVKLDSLGTREWDKTVGGLERDILVALQLATDGGYVLAGHSSSGTSADKTEEIRGSFDYWAVKLDAAGTKVWDRTFGGSKTEILMALEQTSDGGYILGGYSPSGKSGDKTQGNQGDNDFWVVRVNAAGDFIWDKTLGGEDQDLLSSLQATSDGGYLLGGSSDSDVSGDKSQGSNGATDQWVVKLDAAGNKQWDRTFGGGNLDGLTSLHQTPDGGYILGGSSDSNSGGDKSQPSQGGSDFWIVKVKGDLVIVPQPHFSAFSPRKDVPGTVVTITGRNLASLTAVLFNGQEADFEVVNDRLVMATVPSNATSGKVTLVNPGGMAQSNGSFWVQHPVITTFLPSRGRVGSTVLLLGERFTTVQDVYFDGVRAEKFNVLFDSAMTVEVPEGADTGKINLVLAGGGKCYSKSLFTVTEQVAPIVAGAPAARQEMPEAATTSIKPEAPSIGAYPNPFNQHVTFSFTLAQPQPVTVKVYDLLGRELSLLYKGEARARQAYQMEWRPGAQLPAGLYLIRLQAPDQMIQKKVILAR
jgi:hypothetical protein